MKNNVVKKLTLSGMCLALAYVFPFITGGIPYIGKMLCPMHLPVLVCGFICGAPCGAAVGFVAPLLRSLTLGQPVFFPSGVGMMIELAAYGFFAGMLFALFDKILKKRVPAVYLALVSSMLVGRIIRGAANVLLYSFTENSYSWELFVSASFVNALPGIILQLAAVPPIVLPFLKKRSR